MNIDFVSNNVVISFIGGNNNDLETVCRPKSMNVIWMSWTTYFVSVCAGFPTISFEASAELMFCGLQFKHIIYVTYDCNSTESMNLLATIVVVVVLFFFSSQTQNRHLCITQSELFSLAAKPPKKFSLFGSFEQMWRDRERWVRVCCASYTPAFNNRTISDGNFYILYQMQTICQSRRNEADS